MKGVSKVKYNMISHQVDYEWIPDSPVDILSRDLLINKFTKKPALTLRMLNTTDKGIKSLVFAVECLNDEFETVYESDNVKLSNINAKPHEEFGYGKLIPIGKKKGITTVFCSLKKVVFSDETQFETDEQTAESAMMLSPPEFLNPENSFYEKLSAAAEQSNIKPVFWYEVTHDYWRCTCGHPNKSDATVCSHCLASKQWLDEQFSGMIVDHTKIDEEEKAKIMAEVDAAINAHEQKALSADGEIGGESEKEDEKKPDEPQPLARISMPAGAADNVYASAAVASEKEKTKEKEKTSSSKKILINILIFTPICVAVCIGGFYMFMFKKPTDDKIVKRYEQGIEFIDEGNYKDALFSFIKCEGYLDSMTYVRQITSIYRSTIAAGAYHTVVLHRDGTVAAIGGGQTDYGALNVKEWSNMYAVAAGGGHTLGLKNDGTVLATGYNKYGQCNVGKWTDIIAISAGNNHSAAVDSSGRVFATGENKRGQCEVSEWSDVISVKCGLYHTVGLKLDGTVVAAGDNQKGQCNVSEWTDIIAIAAGGGITLGLKADGTVVSAPESKDVAEWTDIIAIAAGYDHFVGLMSNGRVVAAGSDKDGCVKEVSKWKDVIDVYAGGKHTIALNADGTLYAAGLNNYGQCDIDYLGDIGLSDEALDFNIKRYYKHREALNERTSENADENADD